MPWPSDGELLHGIPIFLEQLIAILQIEESRDPADSNAVDAAGGPVSAQISTAAAQHGKDLLLRGFTVDQVVHDYGDLCQVITELALEQDAAVTTAEFSTLNRCLDDAIAQAVTGFARQREELIRVDGGDALGQRLGALAQELRQLVVAATLALSAVRRGHVGLGGATGAVLDGAMADLRMLIDRSLADLRLMPGLPTMTERVVLDAFIGDVQVAAQLEAQSRGCSLTVMPVPKNLSVDADRQMLFAAVANLLRNAFESGGVNRHVWLRVSAAAGRAFIDVEDECGGLPSGTLQKLQQPLRPDGGDTAGEGLWIARRSVELNGGTLRARELAGAGCVFTIDLPLAHPDLP